MSGITLVVEDVAWRKRRGIQAKLKRAAEAAAKAVKLKGEVTILLAGDKKLAALNHDFRGKPKPTNVLSFPFADGGDIAIAHGVVAREAKDQGKNFADHATHLAVHEKKQKTNKKHNKTIDAKVMEPLEVKILKRLGIADPYRVSVDE